MSSPAWMFLDTSRRSIIAAKPTSKILLSLKDDPLLLDFAKSIPQLLVYEILKNIALKMSLTEIRLQIGNQCLTILEVNKP